MIIRKAVMEDLEAIDSIYHEIHDREEAGEVTIGWIRDVYPVRKTAEDAIIRGDMFVQINETGAVTATGIINQIQVDVYEKGAWQYPAADDKVMVLHTLIVSVRPGHRGSGKEFLKYYEAYAREHGCSCLRLDTNARNTNARSFYRKHGYHLIQPNYVTGAFRKLLEKNGLRRIRYHDLRHSCASLLLANGVPMKQIQEWLGHSDFSTTANVYAHLDYNAKLSSASAMESGMESALDVFHK